MTALPRASATTRPVRLSTVAIAGDRLRHLTVVAGTETPLASTYATLNPPGGTVSPTKSESMSGNTRALGVPGAVPSPHAPLNATIIVTRNSRRMLRSEHRHGEERPQVVVRNAESRRQEADDRPQDLVRDIAVEIEQQLEVRARDRDQGAAGIGDGVRGAFGAVEDRHLAETGARLEHRQRFLARAGDGPRDAHLALGNKEETVA